MTSRGIDNWMARGILAYFRLGRTVRFRLGDMQAHLKANYRVCGGLAEGSWLNVERKQQMKGKAMLQL